MNNRLMSTITGYLLASFALYLGAWYMGFINGNFPLLLFIVTVVTGIYWLAERFYFAPQRVKAAQAFEATESARRAELEQKQIKVVDGDTEKVKAQILRQPWWLDWTAGLFPVIVAVFVLRSFVVEPFKIPSGSMIPTLWVGDLILVNKFTYGLRLPVVNTKITDGKAPQRGDVIVFRYPPMPSQDYIKRIVGLPGDEVAYLDKELTLNGKPVSKTAQPDFLDEDSLQYNKQFSETLGDTTHRLLNHENAAPYIKTDANFPFAENCQYSVQGVRCKVPAGHYFVMGDNRDNSQDSRYWGFVPEGNIVGRAFLIWMNFSHPQRIGSFQ